MPSLRAIIAPVLMALLLSGIFLTLRRDFARRQAADEAALTTLAAIWQEYQMPMPPLGAPLERFEVQRRNDWKQFTAIGFPMPQSPTGKPDTFLCGAQTVDSAGNPGKPIAPHPWLARQEDLSGPDGILGISSLYGVAVHCQVRGWTPLSLRLYRQAARHLPVPPDLAYQLVWQHLLAETLKPGSDRPAIARQMQGLLQAGHDLPQSKGALIFASLTADNSHATPSPENLIAEMLAERLVSSRILYDAIEVDAPLSDPFYDLEDLGFAAVPALIEHLDDERLTGRMSAAMVSMMVSHPIQVKDLAGKLLRQILGHRLREYAKNQPRPGPGFKALVTAVWAQAQAMGEEAWLVDGAPSQNDETFPNTTHLRLLVSRHPERLPDVLRFQLNHRSKCVTHPILTALGVSPLPAPDKLALFKEAAALKENPETRRSALEAIRLLDPDYFRQEAIKDFDHMPSESTRNSPFPPEVQLAHLAEITTDPEIWAAFQRATQRAELRLRMELIDSVTGFTSHPENQSLRLQFLSAFLDDLTPRDLEEPQFYEAWAARDIPLLRVCDLAAMQAARALGWPDRPDKNWTEPQWNLLRARIAKAVPQTQSDAPSIPSRGQPR